MSNFDDMKLAVEALSGGKNTVLFDDIGMPSIMVVLPKMISKDILTGATETIHPGFVLDGVEKEKVALSKYHNIIVNERAYSLPMQDPRCSINCRPLWTLAAKRETAGDLPRFPFTVRLHCGARKTALCRTATISGARTLRTRTREE